MRHCGLATLVLTAVAIAAFSCGGSASKAGPVADDVLRAIAMAERGSASNVDDIARIVDEAAATSGRSSDEVATAWLKSAQTQPSTAARVQVIARTRTIEDIIEEFEVQQIARSVLCDAVVYSIDEGRLPTSIDLRDYVVQTLLARAVPTVWAQDVADDVRRVLIDLDNEAPGKARLIMYKLQYC